MKTQAAFFSGVVSFLKRQQHDWKVTVVRTSLDRFTYRMIYPYLSVYIVALGATATQLGMVNAAGMIVAGLVGPLSGWFIDRTGPKKIYLIGIGFLAVSYFTYSIAQSWPITIMAMVTYWLGFSVSIHGCSTVCGTCLANEDRATGMSLCETTAAGLLGMVAPLLAAWLITVFGGVNVSGIRPLFFISVIVTIGTFFLILTQLSGQRPRTQTQTKPNLLRDLNQVLKEGRYLKRWLLISAIGSLPMGMVFPFSQVFAYQIKGADQYVLGAMITGSALVSVAFSVPMGRLADRVGRKRVLYTTMPLFWASNLLLVWAPNAAFLIFAGVLQGFQQIGMPISQAMERELVPPDQMGRWLGITRFFRMPVSAGLALIAGIIWDKVGPQYIFLIFIAVELVLRLPLLISMPETLRLKTGRQTPLSAR